jgi:endonuclease YncB( thermonuclease family)
MWATGRDGQLKLTLILTSALVALATPAHAQDFSCTVASITDGDTFRCTDGKKIRIHGIDAPEMDTQQGPASKVALAQILSGKVVVCEQNGTSYDRIVATCLLDGQDIAALMVQQAQARDCPRYSGGAYAQYEDTRHLRLPIGEFCWP